MSRLGVPAFSLSSPWMLSGLVLALVPLLIHLFYRRRYQEVSWAAVLFLSAAVRRNAQKHRLQQLLLLLLRTLALVVLVFGFARPLLDTSLATPGTPGRTHRLILIDSSLSMRTRADQGTRFDRAIELAKDLVESSQDGDSWQFMLIGGAVPQPVVAQATSDRSVILNALDEASCSARRGDQGNAWSVVRRMLEDGPAGLASRQVYLLSDLQSHEWSDNPPQSRTAALRAVAEVAELIVIDVKNGFAPNLSVADLQCDRRFVTTDETTTFTATVRNIDSQPVADRAVRLLVDDRVVATRSISVAAFSRQTVSFEHRLPTPGRYRVSVECDADRLPEDNRACRVLQAFEDVPVLIVNGKPSSRPMANASDFLRLSLDPGRDVGWDTPYRVRVASEVEFASVRLEDYAAVFVCNLRQFTADEAARLKRYVYSGGAVVLCLGDQVDLQNYNSRLLGERGLLAARLQQTVGDAVRPEQAFLFDASRLDHPLMAVYRGNPGHGLENTLTFCYIRAGFDEAAATRAALVFSNGDPVVLEAAYGAGTACLVTVPGDASQWSTWNTTSGTFAALMNEIAQFSIGGRGGELLATAGQLWSYPVARTTSPAVTATQLEDGQELAARVADNEPGPRVVIDEVPEPGFVHVVTEDTDLLLAVNVHPDESDLRGAAAAVLRDSWLPETDFRIESFATFRPGPNAAATSAGGDVALALFSLLLVLLIAEQLLASRGGWQDWSLFLAGGGVLLAFALLPVRQALTIATITAVTAVVMVLELRRRRSSAGKR